MIFVVNNDRDALYVPTLIDSGFEILYRSDSEYVKFLESKFPQSITKHRVFDSELHLSKGNKAPGIYIEGNDNKPKEILTFNTYSPKVVNKRSFLVLPFEFKDMIQGLCISLKSNTPVSTYEDIHEDLVSKGLRYFIKDLPKSSCRYIVKENYDEFGLTNDPLEILLLLAGCLRCDEVYGKVSYPYDSSYLYGESINDRVSWL